MELKTRIINAILAVEGGYVNDPSDSGGETNFGITIATARRNGYKGPMIELTREEAFNIYANEYWHAVDADGLALLSEAVCEEVVDTGVNMGTGRAARILQRCLNLLNNRGKLWPDIVVDGKIGPASRQALSSCLVHRDEATFLKMLNCMQGAKYIELAERREKDEKFVYGWFKERVVV